MFRAGLQRKTVDEDPGALPGSQVYIEASGRAWHDLRFVHASLANHGLTRQWKWYRGDVERAWRKAGVDGTHFHLHVAPATQIRNICTSFALVMALWVHVGSLRAARAAHACAAWLRAMCLRAAETYTALAPTQSHRLFTLGEVPLDVCGGARASGWRSLLNAQHPRTRASWTQLWSAMRRDGFLASDWSQDEHDLADVVHFVLFCRTMRASQRKTGADSTRRVLGALRDALVTYLGAALDTYLVQVYLPGREDKPPPALNSPMRRNVQVEPEAIWGFVYLKP